MSFEAESSDGLCLTARSSVEERELYSVSQLSPTVAKNELSCKVIASERKDKIL